MFHRLTRVSLESAVEVTDGSEIEDSDRVHSVEKCECPEGYHGSSCEACAIGYYQQSQGPYGPICAPCNCHGHAQR